MNFLRRQFLTLAAGATALPAFSSNVAGQAKDGLVGSYILVSVVATRSDGSKRDSFGPNPKGMLILTADGRYSLHVLRSDLPKFASDNRAMGSAEENKAIVQGSNCHFGTYEVNQANKTIDFRIEFGIYPNWNGAEQRRTFAHVGNEFRYTVSGGSGGSQSVELTWRKVS